MDEGTIWTPITCDSLYISSDGIYDILYRSIDGANNEETPKSIRLMIDSTAPITTASTRYVFKQSAQITFTATDNLSGVSKTEYSQNYGATWIVGTEVTVTTSGTHTILYRSIDVAGNREQNKSITFNLHL
jgi:hypothetical protein